MVTILKSTENSKGNKNETPEYPHQYTNIGNFRITLYFTLYQIKLKHEIMQKKLMISAILKTEQKQLNIWGIWQIGRLFSSVPEVISLQSI